MSIPWRSGLVVRDSIMVAGGFGPVTGDSTSFARKPGLIPAESGPVAEGNCKYKLIINNVVG